MLLGPLLLSLTFGASPSPPIQPSDELTSLLLRQAAGLPGVAKWPRGPHIPRTYFGHSGGASCGQYLIGVAKAVGNVPTAPFNLLPEFLNGVSELTIGTRPFGLLVPPSLHFPPENPAQTRGE